MYTVNPFKSDRHLFSRNTRKGYEKWSPKGKYRGHYMAVRRYEISVRVMKSISRVNAAIEGKISQQCSIYYINNTEIPKPLHLNIFLLPKARFIM